MTKIVRDEELLAELDQIVDDTPRRELAKLALFRWWKFGWGNSLKPRRWYWGVKTFIQRGRRGWADRDVWNLDHYLARVIGESVHHLAVIDHGWPQSETYPTYESFVQDLCKIACAFERYSRLDVEEAHEYEQLPFSNRWRNLSAEEKGLLSEHYDRCRRRQEETLAEMKRIVDVWPSLWD